MPRRDTLPVPADDWVELTDADITNITFQNNGRNLLLIQGTVDAVKPTSPAGALRYKRFTGIL